MEFFVIDENHNLIEAYDKEGVLAVLEQAIADGSLSGITADSGFISKLKCCVSNGTMRVAFVTQAKYNELQASGGLLADCIYYITDDTTVEDIDKKLAEQDEKLAQCSRKIENIIYGDIPVNFAWSADIADNALQAKVLNSDEILADSSGYIPITETGLYTVIAVATDYSEGQYSTYTIAVPDLFGDSVSTQGVVGTTTQYSVYVRGQRKDDGFKLSISSAYAKLVKAIKIAKL